MTRSGYDQTIHHLVLYLGDPLIPVSKTIFASVPSKSLLAAFACLSVVLTASCVAAPEADTADLKSTQSAPTASATPVPQPSATEPKLSPIAEESIDLLRSVGIELDDVVKVKGGSYPTYRVLPSSRFAEYKLSTMEGDFPAGWDSQDADDAQLVAANYLMNHVLDSAVANDFSANKNVLLKNQKSIVHPDVQKLFETESTFENMPGMVKIFQDGKFVGDKSKDFRYVSDGVTPRISKLEGFALNRSLAFKGGMHYEYSGEYAVNVVDKSGKPYYMAIRILAGVTVGKHKDGYKVLQWNTDPSLYSDLALLTPDAKS